MTWHHIDILRARPRQVPSGWDRWVCDGWLYARACTPGGVATRRVRLDALRKPTPPSADTLKGDRT